MLTCGTVPRSTVLAHYLKVERLKGRKWSGIAPADDAPAAVVDEWLEARAFKYGVLGGFAAWTLVRLTRAELLSCAIEYRVASLMCARVGNEFSQVLETLARMGALQHWKFRSDVHERYWYGPLVSGGSIAADLALIARPAYGAESPALLYLEDGTGRSVAFSRYAAPEATAHVFVGTEPDVHSPWLRDKANLSAHFHEHGADYDSGWVNRVLKVQLQRRSAGGG